MGWFDPPIDNQKLDLVLKGQTQLAINQASNARDLDDIKKFLRQVLTQGDQIMTTQAELKAKLDAVLANVADLPTKIQGIEQVLTNLHTEIQHLKDLMASSSTDIDTAVVDQVDAIDAAITTGKQRILDDINANTTTTT